MPSHTTAPPRRRAALLLMVASGFAGLGYQVVWTQQCATWLGHESAAVLAVVAAIFGGLATGAFAFGGRIERSAAPVRWYAGCELAIGLWSLVLTFAMPSYGEWMLALTGVQPTPAWQWAVAFLGTFCLLLPATAAMGATLPAMERATVTAWSGGRSIAAFYASNTFGAVIGVAASALWLVPVMGLSRTALLCGALNIACAVAALAVLRPAVRVGGGASSTVRCGVSDTREAPASSENVAGPVPSNRQDLPTRSTLSTASTSATATATTTTATAIATTTTTATTATPTARRGLLGSLALTGLLGIGYEVMVVRVISQVAEDTVYTFAILLAVYLVGTAIGAAAYQRWLSHRRDAEALGDRLLGAVSTACLLGTASLWVAEPVAAAWIDRMGADLWAAVSVEGVLALAAFGLPTVAMGALFSHLSARAAAAGVDFGRALGANTLGAALAPLVFGVWVAPAVGPKATLLLIVVGYVVLAARRGWRTAWVWGPAAAAALVAVVAPPLFFVDIPDGGRLVSYRDGVLAAVSVVEDAGGVSRLRINNRQQEGSSATGLVDGRQALLPLLLHPAPARALFLGLGTGVTASTAALDAGLHVDAVELSPEVIAASAHFARVVDPDGAAGSRLHVMAADARRFVRATADRYDVIVADNYQPARSGSAALYTTEHFAAVRERLSAHGLFCQWLPLHQMDLATLRSIVRSFMAVYPGASAVLASNSLQTPVVGLVGRHDDGERFDLSDVRARLAGNAFEGGLARYGFDDEFALLGSFMAGPKALAAFARDAPLNTDDRPVVAYLAPRMTYAPDSLPQDRLVALLQATALDAAEVMAGSTAPDMLDRLTRYAAARDAFIEAGRGVRPSGDVRVMLSQVRDPLLAVLRTSPDFRPAYDPLLKMATALGRSDAPASRSLLEALRLLQPAREEAAIALRATAQPQAR